MNSVEFNPIGLSEARHIFEASKVAIVVNDHENILFANPAAATLFGYQDPSEIIDTYFINYFKEEDREIIETRAKERITGNIAPSKYDVHVKKADNTFVNVEFNLSTIKFQGNKAILNIINDVTEREKQKNELIESEHKYRLILEKSLDLIFIIKGTICLYSNPAHTKFLGIEDSNDLIGSDLSNYLLPDEQELALERARLRLEGKKIPTRYNSKINTPIGIREIEGEAVNINWEGSSATLCIARDITENIEEQEKMETSIWALGERVKELKCLYAISNITDNPDLNMGQILDGILYTIPPVWQHPQETCARISLDDKTYHSINCHESEWRQASDIIIDNQKRGTVEVFYSEEMPEFDEGPFLEEERSLLDEIADRIAKIVKRKEMEAEINKLSRAVEQSGNATVITDIMGNIEYVNPKFVELSGYSVEEVMGKNPRVLKSENTSSDEYKKLWNNISSGYEWDGEFLNKRKNGSDYWVWAKISPIRNRFNVITHYLGIQEDITERRRIEDELKLSEERYRRFLEEANDGVTVNILGKLVYVNPMFCQMMGYSEDELIGKSVLDLTAPDYVDLVQDRTVRRQEGQDVSSQYQVELVRKDESIIPVEYNVSLIEYEGENASLTFIRDNTFQKQAELEINKRLHDLAILNEASTMLTKEIDIQSSFNAIIEYAVRITGSKIGYAGYFNEERQMVSVIHGSVWDQCNVPGVTRGETVLFEKLSGLWGYGIENECHVVSNDLVNDPRYSGVPEGHVEVNNYLSVLIMDEGNILGQIAVSNKPGDYLDEDVRMLETLANDSAAVLRKIMTIELLEKQNNQLLELDELKSRFVVTATHELRTPVTSILGFVDFMLQDESLNLSDDVTNNLEIVLRNANRLAVLTNDLLDLQRIQTGRLEIYPEEFDFAMLVNHVIEELTPLLQEKNHVLHQEIPERIIILGDETRLSQLLINLLRNANKFTRDDGEISLSVEVIGDKVQVRVKDSGIGIDPDDMGKLFKPFPGINHGLNVTSSGLGLSISKGIVELHNGAIWAESEGRGKGSTFSVELPL